MLIMMRMKKIVNDMIMNYLINHLSTYLSLLVKSLLRLGTFELIISKFLQRFAMMALARKVTQNPLRLVISPLTNLFLRV